MMEFTDSLTVGLGRDVDLNTFKVTDQLSGRSMGIRADMTPQIARIDAHSLQEEGVTRLCYTGHVLKARVKGALEARNPMQVGAELFGWNGLDADAEIMSLLLSAFDLAHVEDLCLDLGHVGIYRALAEFAGLSDTDEAEFFELLQSKAMVEIGAWVKANIADEQMSTWLLELPRLFGSLDTIDKARAVFDGAPDEIYAALDELEAAASLVSQRFPGVEIHFDLSELAGYHYTTGLVFAVYVPGQGTAVARGGRYDHIGEVFGRARSAIGFTADLVALCRLGGIDPVLRQPIFALISEDPKQWQAVQELRHKGEVVIVGSEDEQMSRQTHRFNRVLRLEEGEYQVISTDN